MHCSGDTLKSKATPCCKTYQRPLLPSLLWTASKQWPTICSSHNQFKGKQTIGSLSRTTKWLYADEHQTASAKFYYLRSVLHDWPDDKCIGILRNIAPAMGASSRILIDEVVVPDQGVSWQIAQMDLFVMSSLGLRERTNLQWRDLCQRAGFEVLDIVLYSRTFHNSVIVIVPK